MDSAAESAPPPPVRAPETPAPAITPINKDDDAARHALYTQVIQQLRVGFSQAMLYALGTRQFEKVCDVTHTAINALLASIGTFKLTVTKAEAHFNAERADIPLSMRSTVEQLDKIMSTVGKNSLRFEPGVTPVELGSFLQKFVHKKLPSADGTKVNQFLRDENIAHIAVDELRYVALGEGESIIAGDEAKLHHAMAQRTLSGLVESALASIVKVADSEARTQLRAELADQLIEGDTEMLLSMLAASTQRLKSSDSDKITAIAALPRRDGLLLGDAIEVARALAERGITDPGDPIIAFQRKLVERLLEPYMSRAEDILSQISIEKDSMSMLPDWLLQTAKSLQAASAAERLEGILRQSPCALLDEKMFAQITDIVDELLVAGMNVEAERLMTHLSGTLRAVTKRERMLAVQRLTVVLDRLMDTHSNPVKILENALREACTHETTDEVMKLLIDHISTRCIFHYKGDDAMRALDYLRFLGSLEESSRLAMRDEAANLARLEREKMGSSDFARMLVDDLLSGNIKSKAAGQMAQVIGSNLWGVMVERLKVESNAARSIALATLLRGFGKDATRQCVATLAKESDSAVAVRLISLAAVLGEEAELWNQIPALLAHPDPAVHGKAMEFVTRKDSPQSVQTIADMLRAESRPEQRKKWARALAHLSDPTAKLVLLELLDETSENAEPHEELQMLLLETIPLIDAPEIVGSVGKLLKRKSRTLITSGERSVGKAVTLAAIRSLGRYYQTKEALEILEPLRRDKDPDVNRLALVCQRGIVAGEMQQLAEAFASESPAAVPLPVSTTAVPAPPPPVSPLPRGDSAFLGPRKARRGFEDLESSGVSRIFKLGSAIGAPTDNAVPKAPERGNTARFLVQKSGEPSLEGANAAVQGVLDECGLHVVLKLLGGKDGILRFQLPDGEGRIYLKAQKIVSAASPGKKGMESVAAMNGTSGAPYAFFMMAVSVPAMLDLPYDQIADALEKQRDQKDQNMYFE